MMIGHYGINKCETSLLIICVWATRLVVKDMIPKGYLLVYLCQRI